MDETQPYSAAALAGHARPEPPPAPPRTPLRALDAPGGTVPDDPLLPAAAGAGAGVRPVPTYGRPMVPAPYGSTRDRAAVVGQIPDHGRAAQLLLPLVGVCGVGRLYASNIAIGLVQLLGFFFGAFLVLFSRRHPGRAQGSGSGPSSTGSSCWPLAARTARPPAAVTRIAGRAVGWSHATSRSRPPGSPPRGPRSRRPPRAATRAGLLHQDKHHYTSPWFQGAHRIVVPFRAGAVPYPDRGCADDHAFHHGLDVAMPCGTPSTPGSGSA